MRWLDDFRHDIAPWFGHATLRRLGFLQRRQASRAFGGSRAYDYDVYAIPKK